ncbi:acyl-CoA thioesterase [Phytoactinopolyspora endophytica]|uniref:acyl-CoA thioesterase n=1 Tax=Phytoactinopolyspora endophytica TaxID=1642495 RepID=UPI00101DD4DC|nr:acyl-CoA thioesterase II [Phytoactinopolyspora endophytica]
MPDSLDDLTALLDLETIEDNLFRGRQPRTRLQRVFGGQVAGQALMAAARTVPSERTVHSLHAYFLRAGDTTVPIVYDVELVRDGRSFTTRRVVARQHGRPIFYVTASFQKMEQGLDHQDVMPEAPPPEQCPRVADVLERVSGQPSTFWDQEWAALDVRYVGDSRPGGQVTSPEHPALARLWFRAAGRLPDELTLHACVLTYASDQTLLGATLVPHGTYIGASDLQTASLDHTMWFHRPFRADEWLLYDQVAPSAYGARGLALGRVFTQDGILVATIAQEGLIRPVSPARS